MNRSDFYGFRANVTFTENNIFNSDYFSSSSEKHELFKKIIMELKKEKKTSDYSKREYQLIFVDERDEIIHCLLARKRETTKYRMTSNDNIENEKDEDYPYVNVLIDVKGQKFLIEKNSLVFDDYNTSVKVISKILSKELENLAAEIIFYPIISDEDFWSYTKNNKNKIYSVTFTMNAPNLFHGSTAAEELMTASRDISKCDKLVLELKNSEGNLDLKQEEIHSFVSYTTNGGGKWAMSYKGENERKRQNINSKQESERTSILVNEHRKIELGNEIIYREIVASFNSIESFDDFKKRLENE